MKNDIILIVEPNLLEISKAKKVFEKQGSYIFVAENISYAQSALKMTSFFSAAVVEIFTPLTTLLPSSYNKNPLGLVLAEKCLELNIPCLLIYKSNFIEDLRKIQGFISTMEGNKNCKQKSIPLLSKDEGWEKIIAKVIELININNKH